MNINGDDPDDEPTEEEIAAYEFSGLIQDYANQFDALAAERHEKGQQEYGAFTFLENDVVRMLLEELADTVNYCRMQGIKLLMLQDAVAEKVNKEFGSDDEGNVSVQIGAKAFKGTGEVGWKR